MPLNPFQRENTCFIRNGEAEMNHPSLKWPIILFIDDDHSRIEFYSCLFFRKGYNIRTAPLSRIKEKEIMDDVKLVLSFLPFDPQIAAKTGVPVLFIIRKDVSMEAYWHLNSPGIACMTTALGTEAILNKIDGMIGKYIKTNETKT